MKNNDITKSYRTRFIISLIVSALAACLSLSLLIYNFGGLKRFLTGTEMVDTSFTANDVLLFVIFGVIIFGLVFYLLQRKSINYIKGIAETVEKISAGDLEARAEVRGDDEFSGMAESVNRMAGDLKELLRLERESEQQKTELITNIAHDLRTPLTSVIGYLELLSGKGYDHLSESQKKKYLSIAYTKAKRLEQLIDDLFEFTKLSCGKITMNVTYLDIVKLLAQLLEESYPSFRDKGLRYELHTNTDSQEIMADPTLMARLFENLIGNAIKYGADGKKVEVRVKSEPEANAVEVKVINYGFVIDEEDLPRIFEKFYRTDKARNTETGGSGLGLAICRNIVDMHGGTITVTSDLEGTVFTVRLKIHFEKSDENLRRA